MCVCSNKDVRTEADEKVPVLCSNTAVPFTFCKHLRVKCLCYWESILLLGKVFHYQVSSYNTEYLFHVSLCTFLSLIESENAN